MPNRVLIADDDGNLRSTLAEVCAQAGIETILAPSGDVALTKYDEAVAEGDPPAALLVDLLLPKVAGFDVIKKLKEKGSVVPFIAMSGVFKGSGHQEEAQKLGAAGFLAKPFDNAVLIEKLQKLTGVGPAAEPEIERLPMPAEGTLLEHPVLHLLWRAERERHSGVLEVFSPRGRGRVFVYEGQSTLAQHWAKTLNVGFQLVRSGALTPEMYQTATEEAVADGLGLYDVIKSKAWVRDVEIKDAYRALIPEIIRRLLAASGNFRWVATDAFTKAVPTATTKLGDILFSGLHDASPEELTYHVEPRAALRLAPGEQWNKVAPHLERACGSSSLERAINGRATISQMLSAARSDEDRLARMRQVFLLMSTRAVQASLEVISVATMPEAPATPAPTPAPASAPKAAAPRATTVAAADAAALDAGITFRPEDDEARTRIREAYERVRGKDHWAVLGVPREADAGAIKKAYFALARDFHADSFAGLQLGAAQATLADLFALISEAYGTLSHAQKRAEYEASQSMKDAGMSTDLGALFAAEHDFEKGRLLLERGEMTSAAKFFEKALAANPSNIQWEAHHIFSHWWVARDPQKAAAAVQRLEAIYKQAETFLDALYFAGRLLAECGAPDRGIRALRKVLEANPTHALAQRDIKHMQKKLEDAKQQTGGGVMNRLLKR